MVPHAHCEVICSCYLLDGDSLLHTRKERTKKTNHNCLVSSISQSVLLDSNDVIFRGGGGGGGANEEFCKPPMPMVNNYINLTCPPEFKKIKQYKKLCSYLPRYSNNSQLYLLRLNYLRELCCIEHRFYSFVYVLS